MSLYIGLRKYGNIARGHFNRRKPFLFLFPRERRTASLSQLQRNIEFLLFDFKSFFFFILISDFYFYFFVRLYIYYTSVVYILMCTYCFYFFYYSFNTIISFISGISWKEIEKLSYKNAL